MIILGVVLLLLGYLLPLPYPVDPLLIYGGWILVVVGVVFWILGASGRPVGGRARWY